MNLLSPIHFITFTIDALFAYLGLLLVKNIASKKPPRLQIPLYISLFFLTALSFFYLTNTYSISNVWLNSHPDTPTLYKFAGLWGNHEGSMLLFLTFLTVWATLLVKSPQGIQLASFVLLALGAYVYLQANPFSLLAIKAASGQDLNPALQNPYLAIHPPILYAGQTLCFVLWVKACFTPNHPKIKQYILLCFCLITAGLALGARWAYGELGWGGFWFWDPVETVSLFPWLAVAAAVHASKNSHALRRLCMLLSFPMVMVGMTLVRSGILVSVHSFGLDLHNGIWLGSVTLAVCTITALVFFKTKPMFQETSLRTIIPYGFLGLLALLCTLILAPIVINICFSTELSIDEKFFHQYLNPLLLVCLIFCGLAPFMRFQKIMGWNILCSLLCTALWCLWAHPILNLYAAGAAFIGFWLMVSTANYYKELFTKGFIAAHVGVGLCILGASHAEIFTDKQEYPLNHLPKTFASLPIKFVQQRVIDTPQKTQEIFDFDLAGKQLSAERQHFHISHTTKHQPNWVRVKLDHIHATCFAEGELLKVELMYKPYITLFWLGVLFVLLGIVISLKISFYKTLRNLKK